MRKTSRVAIAIGGVLCLAALSVGLLVTGMALGKQYQINLQCCLIPSKVGNVLLSAQELAGLKTFYSQIGQDKWVSETVFPGVTDGFFVDVGSADGTKSSNSRALEAKGWTGICVDPFPTNMEGRTCRMVKDPVYSTSGQKVTFQAPGGFGADSFGHIDAQPNAKDPTVELTTITLADILARANAPRFIHYLSMDIEGAELDALRGFPFDTYRLGAINLEHNFEEPKRTEILELLKLHGYIRIHTWLQDDFYVPAQR